MSGRLWRKPSVRETLAIHIVLCAALVIPATALGEDAVSGKAKYDIFCVSCHGFTGKGDGPFGFALQPPPRDFTKGAFKFDTDKSGEPGTDVDLANVIAGGAGKYGGNMMMAPWGDTLSGDEISDLIAYIRSLKE